MFADAQVRKYVWDALWYGLRLGRGTESRFLDFHQDERLAAAARPQRDALCALCSCVRCRCQCGEGGLW